MMNRLVVRIYAVTVLFFVLALGLVQSLSTWVYDHSEAEFLAESQRLYQIIKTELMKHPQSEWEKVLGVFSEVQLHHELRLWSAAAFGDWDHQTISDDLIELETEDDLWLLYPIHDSPMYLGVTPKLVELVDPPVLSEVIFPQLLVLAALAFGLVLVLRSVTSPINDLSQAVSQFSAGDLSIRVDEKAPEPVGRLAKNFNQMADHISQQMQRQQIMIAAIPHELQSPVGRIRFALDLLSDASLEQDKALQLERLTRYTQQMEQSIDDVIRFIRIQTQGAMQTDTVDMQALVNDLLTKMDDDRITLQTEGQSFNLICNEAMIRLALKNLISNALRYANGAVALVMFDSENGLCVCVDDDGPGIAVADRKQLFIPFAKIEKHRMNRGDGLGLGLSLVQLVMSAHGGDVTVNASELGGASFTITFPK